MFCHAWAQSTLPHLAFLRSSGERTNGEAKAQGQNHLAPETPLGSGMSKPQRPCCYWSTLCAWSSLSPSPAELIPTRWPGAYREHPHSRPPTAPSTSVSDASPVPGSHCERGSPSGPQRSVGLLSSARLSPTPTPSSPACPGRDPEAAGGVHGRARVGAQTRDGHRTQECTCSTGTSWGYGPTMASGQGG